MTALKKEGPEKKDAKTSPDTRSMRDVAEQKLADSRGSASKLTGQTPEELIHELRVHQIELETQAEELRRIQQELEISRYKYLDLYDFAPVGYLTLNDKAMVTEANLTAATLLGVERRTLARARFRKYIAPADLDPWDQYFIRLLKVDKKQPCTLTLIRGDGSTFPARLESLRHTMDDGSIAIRVVISDISDIKKAQDALLESEEKFRLVIESAPNAIFIQTEGQFAYVNPAACRLFGAASPDHLIGKPVLDQFHPDFREIVKERIRRLNEER
jgi:PAS domain S-box-containing protein